MGGFLSHWLNLPTFSEKLRSQGVREDLVQAAAKAAFARHSERDLPALGGLLTRDEVVQLVLEGRHQGRTGLLVLTTHRLLFAPPAVGQDGPVIVPASEVKTAEARTHRGLGVLDVDCRTGAFVVDQIIGIQAEWMAEALQQACAPLPDPPVSRRDPLEELSELRTLHNAGAVDDDEFRLRKARLFDQI